MNTPRPGQAEAKAILLIPLNFRRSSLLHVHSRSTTHLVVYAQQLFHRVATHPFFLLDKYTYFLLSGSPPYLPSGNAVLSGALSRRLPAGAKAIIPIRS